MKYLDFASSTNGGTSPERLVIVIDVSGSMDNADWSPSRLHGAIKAAGRLLDVKFTKHPDDEVGVVVFSSRAKTVHMPAKVSKALNSIKKALANLDTESSTNITAGLKEARKNLGVTSTKTNSGASLWDRFSNFMGVDTGEAASVQANELVPRIILLTDGKHNCMGTPCSVAEKLKNAGVTIDCIGIGGSPSEVKEESLKAVASKNPDGSPRYCFIGDQHTLIKKFEQLGNRITTV